MRDPTVSTLAMKVACSSAAEHADRDEGLQQLHGDEARARETGEGQGPVALAVLEQPVDAADLVDFRIRRSPADAARANRFLRGRAATKRALAVDDAVGEAAQRAR